MDQNYNSEDIIVQLLKKSFAARSVGEQKIIVQQERPKPSEDQKSIFPRRVVFKEGLALWKSSYNKSFLLALFTLQVWNIADLD